jgi:hypothetical protein
MTEIKVAVAGGAVSDILAHRYTQTDVLSGNEAAHENRQLVTMH